MIQFYVGKLGFEMEKDETLPPSIAERIFHISSGLRFVRLICNDVKVELFEPLQERYGERSDLCHGYHHWGFVTGDREAFSERLKREGVDVVELDRDGHMVYFARDPDSNLIEIR
jgi:catechol 2,3-dioxygenase-like lactoylglutathione lyase family enzyme